MQRIPPNPVVTKGLDVSHYQGAIDFHAAKAAGFSFCYAKCSEYIEDDTFERHRAGAKEAGLLYGAYHFFHPTKSPSEQARIFLEHAKPQPGELLPTLDWEVTDGIASMVDRARALNWLEIVSAAIGGRKPIIYGAPYFLQALGLDAVTFAKYPLWIAHYGVNAPLVPSPWGTWCLWQNSEHGAAPGVSGGVDIDLFNGSLDAMRLLTI